MFAAERRHAILELLRVNGSLRLRDIAETVGSTEVTVRRDLRILGEQGLLDRHRGGAAAPGALSKEQPYTQKARMASAEKRAIAVAAAALVRDGDAIVLGAGSTTEELARHLVGFHDLTVVTNSMLVGAALARESRVEVVMTGGQLRGSTFALVGSAAEQSLAGLRVRLAFLSGNGLTPDRGLSTPNMAAASMDRVIAATAEDIVVVADHTKLGIDTMFQTVPSEEIAHLVIDDAADIEPLEELRAIGVTVHVAAVQPRREPMAASTP